ncbi:MAG: hypothetical protein CMH46_07045 [Muricauda sp.]|nr:MULTISPECIES: DUF2851 family protein [unclassified Allomuricauda]MAU15279.1 hypothetical protein [Allomuricauda sp.]|tara:strand:+ start:16898 stop:18178 length:1281 start_codon:yes stop_codon:yes gene_type:complete
MREDLLYFIWKQNKLPTKLLCTGNGDTISIKAPGIQNRLEGPDFFNAKIEIDGQLWAGNVEMHIKSSDWYVHHHETDKNYDNVILHVVWEDDIAVFRKDGSQIPTLEVKQYVSNDLMNGYHRLMETSNTSFINCEKDLKEVDSFLVENWLHRLYIERLEHKSKLILELLETSKNDWEAVLFVLLAKNFGSKVNGPYFLDRAKQLDFSLVRKTSNEPHQLEALLFGHFGLLKVQDCTDEYYLKLKKEYEYLVHKFELAENESKPAFYGLRPLNFPTIRVSQLVKLYVDGHNIFSNLMALNSLEDMYRAFSVAAGPYWENSYTFGKVSKKRTKILSKKFIDLIIINTILPLKFCYSKYVGKDWDEELIGLVSQLDKEDNSIIKNFEKIGSKTQNAMESQALLELYNNYCSKNKCMQCAIGSHLLNRNT